MTQGDLIGKGKDMMMVDQPEGLIISVPRFDNSELIRGYSKTLIGRCLNPDKQVTKSFLHILPRILKMEDRVVGADLGNGRFQIDFKSEEDVLDVLSMEPFHFEHWMLSVMRWEPIVDETYPSEIKFWVRIIGLPLQYWAMETFESVAEALGSCEEVDVDFGRVRVTFDGNKPLYSESVLVFDSGDEVTIQLRYERLHKYCAGCYSLCHEVLDCPKRVDTEDDMENHSLSYRAVESWRISTGTKRSGFMADARRVCRRKFL